MQKSLRFCVMMERRKTWLVAGLALGVVALVAPVPWVGADQYSAYAAGIQTLGLVGTLLLGYQTLRGELRDRRVDRALDLHREFVSGEVGEARGRLVQTTRSTDPPTAIDRMSMSRGALQAATATNGTATYEDVVALLRYFERLEAARRAGSLDDLVAASLIGPHARWWDRAIVHDSGKARLPLHSFAEWATSIARSNSDDARFRDWGSTTARDWPPKTL